MVALSLIVYFRIFRPSGSQFLNLCLNRLVPPQTGSLPIPPQAILLPCTSPFTSSLYYILLHNHRSLEGEFAKMVTKEMPKSNASEVVIDAFPYSTTDSADIALEECDGRRNATKSSSTDAENMRRMGRSQELVRNFRMFSMASFATMATAVWEFALFQLTPALVDGGRPNMIYSTIWNFIGFFPIYLSMAEMSSMAPIAGAQYHWVSEFAPRSMQRVLSYVSG